MALISLNEAHALQIQAGTLGRRAGHEFEVKIAEKINEFIYPLKVATLEKKHVFTGDPALLLISYIAAKYNCSEIVTASAISTGALATSEEGKQWLSVNDFNVSRCKCDLVITFRFIGHNESITIGVSTKQCNNANPTNAQLYFTTAWGFTSLLANNNIIVSEKAILALRQFCGDSGYRPSDDPVLMASRVTDPRRFFWEECDAAGRTDWELLFATNQDSISRLLFQKAYLNDPFIPEFILHKTKKAPVWNATEIGLYSVEELIILSRSYQGFATKPYSVKKGSHKDPAGITHLAPRFGIIQMQRGGQAQHPEQLQFNLEASYFYKV
jgi:hypothetical protein